MKRQPPRASAEDPVDVFEHGVSPTHHLTSPLHSLQRGQQAPHSFGGILVRLPRRLSKIVAEDAHRWIRGETPISVEPAPSATRWGTRAEWERAYPGRGLGLPKPLARRRAPWRPLTVYDLRQRVARLEAAGHRPEPDGFFHVHLLPHEITEVIEDPEYQRCAAGLLGDLPAGCVGQVHSMRLYPQPSMPDVFGARMRQLGEAAGNALNELVRRRLLERPGG